MKKFLEITKDILLSAVNSIIYFFKVNIYYIMQGIEVALPFIMYYVGLNSTNIKLEVFIPAIVLIFLYYFKAFANRIGRGITIPVPNKRFTETDTNDEVSIEQARLSELLLYVNDLEDWLERKGLL